MFPSTTSVLVFWCDYPTLNGKVNSPGDTCNLQKSQDDAWSLGLILSDEGMKMTVFNPKLFYVVNVTVSCLKLNIGGIQTFDKPAGFLK